MAAPKAAAIQVSPGQERELNDLVRAHTTPQKLAERARIILLAAAGKGMDESARMLGVWRKTVRTGAAAGRRRTPRWVLLSA